VPARFWDPGRKLLRAIRDYQRFEKSGPIISWMRFYAVLRYRFWSVITGADIPINSHIGGGLLIPHPNGIVIHPDSRIGVNCLLFQQVTIGSRGGDGVPLIGGHVDIGPGAKILGRVIIGDHAKIGANAVIHHDVPERKTVGHHYSTPASRRKDVRAAAGTS
jgi:serine O-acetyltransferase